MDAAAVLETMWLLNEDHIASTFEEQRRELAKRANHYLPRAHENVAPLFSAEEREAQLRSMEYASHVFAARNRGRSSRRPRGAQQRDRQGPNNAAPRGVRGGGGANNFFPAGPQGEGAAHQRIAQNGDANEE